MLRLSLLTSSSEMVSISDFHYLYDLARCSKCQMFTLVRATNKLYGASDDCCCIHEIDVPFLVNTDLMFRIDTVDKDLLDNTKSFFIPDKFNWVILPDIYWDMYIGGDLVSEYSYELDQYIIIDKTTHQPIQQIQMYKYRPCSDFGRITFNEQLEGLFQRMQTVSNPITFVGIHDHPIIRKAFDSKAAMGRFLCRMTNEYTDIAFYFYKGLFSLAKADTLDLDVRFDIFRNTEFMAIFKPKKKKNPLLFNTYGVAFQERIYCMFQNII